MRSVVKHSYIKGANRGAKAKAHINYIQYREGQDRVDGPRAFFNNERDDIQGREVKERIDKVDPRFVHKLIFSPGVEGVDVAAYTKSIMTQLGKAKGWDLDWAATVHANTDHDHAHAVLLGKDIYGKEVQLRLKDCNLMREFGDRYLERHHTYERFLDRDLHNLLKEPDYSPQGDDRFKQLLADLKRTEREEKQPERAVKKGRQPKQRQWDKDKAIGRLPEDEKIEARGKTYTKFSRLEDLEKLDEQLRGGSTGRIDREQYGELWTWIGTKRTAGDDFYERQAKDKFESAQAKRREKKKGERPPGEDEREKQQLDKDLAKSFKELDREGSGENFGKGYKARLRETQGRKGADHGHYLAGQELAQLEAQKKAEPDRADELQQKIDELKKWDQDQRAEDSKSFRGLDELLGRDEKTQKELAQILKPREVPLPIREPEKEQQKEQEKQQQLEYKPGEQNRELDDMLGNKHSLSEFEQRLLAQQQSKEQGRELSQQQARKFQDETIAGAQTPELEKDGPERDDGEELFAQGGR